MSELLSLLNEGSGLSGLKQVKNPGITVQRRIRPLITILIPVGNEEQIVNLIKVTQWISHSVLNMLPASVNLML